MTYEQAYALLNKDKVDMSEMMVIMNVALSMLDREYHDFTLVDFMHKIHDKCEENKLLSGLDHIVVNLLVVRGYMHSDYAWRAISYAKEALEEINSYNILDAKDETRKRIAEFYEELGDYFYLVRQYREALVCYKALENWCWDQNIRGYAYYRQIIIHNILKDNFKDFLKEDELFIRFGMRAKDIIRAYKKEGYIKRDPVEATEAFQKVFIEVYEIAAEADKVSGYTMSITDRWQLLTKEFNKRGINWKSPQVLNPKVNFENMR